jgi:TP901 family phage tail tape measure protein
MSQVQATMGIMADAVSEVDGQSVNTMDTLRALAKQMGAETAYSASECADALNYLALAGYNTQEMCDTLPIVLNLAAAGGIDLATASDMVTDAMSALVPRAAHICATSSCPCKTPRIRLQPA